MPTETKRKRSRKFVMIELTTAERAKLERLKVARGERATLAGVIRELLAKGHLVGATADLMERLRFLVAAVERGEVLVHHIRSAKETLRKVADASYDDATFGGPLDKSE